MKIEIATISFWKAFAPSRYKVQSLHSSVVEASLGAQSNQMVKSGIVNRVESSTMEQIDAVTKDLLQGSGFYQFLQRFSGENYGVSMAFA